MTAEARALYVAGLTVPTKANLMPVEGPVQCRAGQAASSASSFLEAMRGATPEVPPTQDACPPVYPHNSGAG